MNSNPPRSPVVFGIKKPSRDLWYTDTHTDYLTSIPRSISAEINIKLNFLPFFFMYWLQGEKFITEVENPHCALQLLVHMYMCMYTRTIYELYKDIS